MRKVIVGMLAEPVCIPLAIIKTAARKRAGMGRFPILPHPPSIYYNKKCLRVIPGGIICYSGGISL